MLDKFCGGDILYVVSVHSTTVEVGLESPASQQGDPVRESG